MTTTSAPDAALLELYGRYKSLAIRAGATRLLGVADDRLAADAARLHADARAAYARRPSEALAACHDAAGALRRLAAGADDALDEVRAGGRRLRRAAWDVAGCEYAPCGTPPHAHADRGPNA
jgi:hypothetical protein